MTATEHQEIDARRSMLQSETERFVAELSRDRDIVGVVLFGSLVDGALNACSDIDLMVVKQTDAPFLDRLRSLRRQLRPKVATDILVYTMDEVTRLWRDRPFFREEVMNRGRVLYERERGALAQLCA